MQLDLIGHALEHMRKYLVGKKMVEDTLGKSESVTKGD